MNTYTYAITTWYDGIMPQHTVSFGKGGWDYSQARANGNAAIRRTDKVPLLNARAVVIADDEIESYSQAMRDEGYKIKA